MQNETELRILGNVKLESTETLKNIETERKNGAML